MLVVFGGGWMIVAFFWQENGDEGDGQEDPGERDEKNPSIWILGLRKIVVTTGEHELVHAQIHKDGSG